MIQYGLIREAFVVVKAISDRYDGRLREKLDARRTASWGYSGNPFGDDECGKFYARAMSVWSLLLACQGFDYDGPSRKIGFDPVWKPDDHRSFFTTAEGWGLFTQKRSSSSQTNRIELTFGRLWITDISLGIPAGMKPSFVAVSLGGKLQNVDFGIEEERLNVKTLKPLVLEEGDNLYIVVRS
jgi:hypothetical protein